MLTRILPRKGRRAMRTDKINYACDDCKEVSAVFRSYKKARDNGWSLARDGVTCWCPECAPAHRLGGANSRKRTNNNNTRQWLPEGFEQLKIDV